MLTRSPVKKRRTKPRRGPLRLPKYRAWLKNQHCHICKMLAETDATRCDFYACIPVDPSHTVNNGTSSKGPDSGCWPLGRRHHEEFDAGKKAFEAKYGVEAKAIAVEYFEQWKAEQA